jgi:hypothetical protein
MLNGLLTLRGAWDKVRTDPVLKFFAAGVTFYGMATFEGRCSRSRASRRSRTTPTGSSATCTRAPSAGTASWPPACSTGWCRALRHQAALVEGRRLPLLDRHRSASCSTWSRCGCGHPQGLMWRAMAPGGGSRTRLRRDADGAPPDVLDAPGGRHHLPGRLHHDGVEPLALGRVHRAHHPGGARRWRGRDRAERGGGPRGSPAPPTCPTARSRWRAATSTCARVATPATRR